MIYFLRVHSNYFYPVKAYFESIDEVSKFCIKFIEKPEFASDALKKAYFELSDKEQKKELTEIFSVISIDKKNRKNYKKLFLNDGIKRKNNETKDKSTASKV